MKVALLLFGQPRHVENLKVFNSHVEHILSKYDTDVFCHAWFAKGHSFIPSTWSKLSAIKCNEDVIDIIQDKYKPKILMHDEPKQFVINENIKTSPAINKFEYLNPVNINNMYSQLYSIGQVSKLFESYRIQNNVEYDFVIMARYDIIILEFTSLYHLDKTFFYHGHHHDRFPDLFYVFHPKFIKSQTTYDNLDFIIEKIIKNQIVGKNYWDFIVECLKYNNFLLYFTPDLIRKMKIIERRNTM